MTNTIAPKRGPMTVATPPSITININSPDLDQSIISGDMKVIKFPKSTPAKPQIIPEKTKAINLCK